MATYAPPSSCLASTKRVLMTDAQDSPLSGRFLLRCEQCFVRSISLFGTENIKCVREILSFRSRRENLNCSDSSIVVFLPKFAIINSPILASHLDLNFHVFVKRVENVKLSKNLAELLIYAVCPVLLTGLGPPRSTLFVQTETFHLSLFHLSQGYLTWATQLVGQGTILQHFICCTLEYVANQTLSNK